jgi:hypothetical protein
LALKRLLAPEKFMGFDMVSGSNENKSRMTTVATWREFLSIDAGHLMLLGVSWVVNDFVNSGLLTDVSGLELIADIG